MSSPPPLPTIDSYVTALQPLAREAAAGLHNVLMRVDNKQSPRVYELLDTLARSFNRNGEHTGELVNITQKAADGFHRGQRSFFGGMYDGIKRRIWDNKDHVAEMVNEISGLVEKNPEGQRIIEACRGVQKYYDQAKTYVGKLDESKSEAFSTLKKDNPTYYNWPIVRNIVKSSKWTLLLAGLGLIAAGVGVYLWDRHRKQRAEKGITHPRVELPDLVFPEP